MFDEMKEDIGMSTLQYTWENVSKVIQSEVNTLTTEFQRLLKENLIGVYLHGSLALGGFKPERSDIDLLVVVGQKMAVEVKKEIVELLLRVSRFPRPVEISFLVEKDIFPYRNPLPYDLHYSEKWREQLQQDVRGEGWKHWDDQPKYDPDLVAHLTILHQNGIVLYGKPIAETLPVVPEHDFRNALLMDLRDAIKNPLHNPIHFVLNACRDEAYFREGTILSKDAGAEWALVNLPAQFHPLIEQSLALYRGERPGRPPGRSALNDFAIFIEKEIQGREEK
jgi:streptomycin 3"-adenylyltransferase